MLLGSSLFAGGVAGHEFVGPSTSVARLWNERLLEAIRNDFARPTVHARNLWHTSLAMYDAWAIYDEEATPFLLGNTVDGYTATFDGVPEPVDVAAAREEAMSFACYRILSSRFANSPGADETLPTLDALMDDLGYDRSFSSIDYADGDPAALGNFIARHVAFFGVLDRSNEQGGYANLHYEPINPTLLPVLPGNPDIVDLDRWQPLTLDIVIDQSGNPIPNSTPPFLSPEWGAVSTFSLTPAARREYQRDGHTYVVYLDPGPPPLLDTLGVGCGDDAYKWGFTLVSVWSSHLDPDDGVLWDISPGNLGNVRELPATVAEYPAFFDLFQGGDPGRGHPTNPVTGQPYARQLVPRADYARVLAEFWADGPDSETPPGHWFVILNHVNDHPLSERRFEGRGPVLDPLEWDVKAYFALGGAMHDAAVAAWGAKGWYDYIRPISAIRAMADRGQCTDPGAPRHHPAGLPLIPGFVESVGAGDPLAGAGGEHTGKIKLHAWRGPDHIEDPATDVAGVDWILAENWWPYQRPTFVTPPFAGYVSGHSTFSRAAAVVLERLTGDPYFPGGIGEFLAPRNAFLVFEEGPSVDVTLQWATYRDASDQTSLSRIWGGIHPPADDIPGRRMGERIGTGAFERAIVQFGDDPPAASAPVASLRPNPAGADGIVAISLEEARGPVTARFFDARGRRVRTVRAADAGATRLTIDVSGMPFGVYFVELTGAGFRSGHRLVIAR